MNNKSPPPRRPALRARPVPAPPQADHRAEGAAGEREEHRGQDDQGQVFFFYLHIYTYNYYVVSLSERLASLGIRGAQLRAP